MSLIRLHLFNLILIFLVSSCQKEAPVPTKNESDAYLTFRSNEYSGLVASEWLDSTHQYICQNKLSANESARIYGYLGLAIWESVSKGSPNSQSLEGQLNGYPSFVDFDQTRVYDWSLVLTYAMKRLLPRLIDGITLAQRQSVNELADRQAANTRPEMTRKIYDYSAELGDHIGLKIAELSESDNRRMIVGASVSLPERDADHPWYWDKSNFGNGPVQPLWHHIRPLFTPAESDCTQVTPFAYSTDMGSDMYLQASEIYQTQNSTSERQSIYYFDNPVGTTSGEAGHLMFLLSQLLKERNSNLEETAKAYCRMGLSLSDAMIATWHIKYKFYGLSPITYIHENIDPNWQPALHEHACPEFVSESAVMGAAGAEVLKSLFDNTSFTDFTRLGKVWLDEQSNIYLLPEQNYSSFDEFAKKMAESKIHAGLQFRFSAEAGIAVGRCIGQKTVDQLQFHTQ